jgi:septal ring factor EnvC (AmiA/AmiB activator)
LLVIQGQTQRPIPMEILLRYSSIKDKYQLADELQQYYAMEAQLQQAQQAIQQLQKQIQDMGGMMNQKDSQIVQIETARKVEKEVAKTKDKLNKELGI